MNFSPSLIKQYLSDTTSTVHIPSPVQHSWSSQSCMHGMITLKLIWQEQDGMAHNRTQWLRMHTSGRAFVKTVMNLRVVQHAGNCATARTLSFSGTTLVQGVHTLLTPWSRALPEKPKRPKLLKKFPAFYGTRRLITAFTRARHLRNTYSIIRKYAP
jgi:hypothetical protein